MKEKYIARFDYKNSTGYQFRYAPDGNWNKTDNAFFSDKDYGGKRKALQAAKDYRFKYLKKHGLLELLVKRKRRVELKKSTNTSGITGVRIAKLIRNGIEYFAWEGYGMRDGRSWCKHFSINKYGEKNAFKWACLERYNRHGSLSVHCKIKEFPCSPGVPYIKLKTNNES